MEVNNGQREYVAEANAGANTASLGTCPTLAPIPHTFRNLFEVEEIRNIVLSFCNIPELKIMSEMNKNWHRLTTCDTHWKEIGDIYFETPLATREQIQNYIQITKKQAQYCFKKAFLSESFHIELQQLYKSECIQDIKYLRSLCKARDILFVWCKLQASLGGYRDLRLAQFQSLKELIHIAEKFPAWFKDNLNQLRVLRNLDLSNKNLTSLPSEIGNLNGLWYLYLSYNQLTSIPSEIGNLTELVYLNLAFNELTTISSKISNLIGLQCLDLSYNKIASLPSEMGNLTRLQQLYLNNNRLKALPEKIGNLQSLQRLYLNKNQLTALPSEIGHLHHLSELNLSHNKLTALPLELENLNLTLFNIKYNPLTNVKT